MCVGPLILTKIRMMMVMMVMMMMMVMMTLGAPFERTKWCIPVVPLGTAVDLSGACQWSHSARLLNAPRGAYQWSHSVRLATCGFGWVVAVFLVG